MRRRNKLALALVVIVVLAVVAVPLTRRPVPTYQGQPIDYFFERLNVSLFSGSAGYSMLKKQLAQPKQQTRREPINDREVFTAFGTNAVPFLMMKLKGQDRSLEKLTARLLHKVGVKRQVFADAQMERGRAVTGLILLPHLPPDVEQNLVTLSTNSNRELAAAARYVREKREEKQERRVALGFE